MDTRENEIKRLEKRRDELEAQLATLERSPRCNWLQHANVMKHYVAVMRQLGAAYLTRNMPRGVEHG